jgi:superfamily I DNA/RNA helicase
MLTEEQLNVVYTHHYHCKVMAAAGSGKTTTLVARMNMLADNGHCPSGMMAITFTRRSGKDLVSKLGHRFSSAAVGTYHSLILNQMGKSGIKLNPLSEEDSDLMIDECAKNLGLIVNGRWVKGSRKKHVEQMRECRIKDVGHTQLSSLYTSRLRINGDIDFDGILILGCQMAQHGMFDWVEFLFVDEAQDNEPLQWKFVNILAEKASVMAVGDIGQSMYAFRGAVPEQFMSQPWPTMALSESFRFPKKVATIANAMGATPLQVVSNRRGGLVWSGKSDAATLVANLIRDGEDPSDIAVLCRYNATVESIRADLIQKDIPVVVPSVVLRGQLHNFLMYLASPNSPTARNKVRTWSGYAPKVVEYIQSKHTSDTAWELVSTWLGRTSTISDILNRLDGIDAFKYSERNQIVHEYGDMTVDQYKAATSDQEWICEGFGVTVGTVHWSKGGEWPIVILPEVDRGKWPRKETDEELRVMYVATTRMQDSLFVCYSDPSDYLRYFTS